MPIWALDLIQTVIDGLLFGSTYALVAIGFTLIWGLLRILNLGHGETVMVGMFAGMVSAKVAGLPFLIGIVLAMLAASIHARASAVRCGGSSSPTRKPEKGLVFLTNNFALDAFTITKLYKCRWQVELFFKWIKQHLRIKAFFGTSENAVKSQIGIAVSVYVLATIVKKRLGLSATLYEMLYRF